VLSGARPSPTPSLPGFLVRYSASGARDLTYGSGGFAALGTDPVEQLLPGPDGSLLAVGLPGRALDVRRVAANGVVEPRPARVDLPPFGGGYGGGTSPIGLASLYRGSFTGSLAQRDDGSYLVAGTVGTARAFPGPASWRAGP
jgi:hypothetical protein